ncbi:flavin reductase [Pseudomonas sp. TE3786]
MRPALETPEPPCVLKHDYRDAMARLGAAVNVITTDGPGGRAGFTASAVCSVTDEPPTLLVCLNRGASVYDSFRANGVVAVNVLAHGQQALSNLFGGKTPIDERFAAGQWHQQVTGAPLLDGALVAFDCRVINSSPVGTHDILFCEVLAIRHGEQGKGLMYFERAYHPLGA